MPTETTIGPTPVSQPWAMKLAELLRSAREYGDKVRVPESVPLIGGTGLGEFVLGDAAEGAERIGYGERLTKGQGQTIGLQPGVFDLGTGALSVAGSGPRVAKGVARVAAHAAENAAKPRLMARAGQRGVVGWPEDAPPPALRTDPRSKQGLLPGIEPLSTEQVWERERNLLKRLVDANAPAPALEKQNDSVWKAYRDYQAEQGQRSQQGMRALREQRPAPGVPESAQDAYAREDALLRKKNEAPIDANVTPAQLQRSRALVRELRSAKHDMGLLEDPAPRPIPNWAEQSTELPTTRGIQEGGKAPAGADWWHKELGIDPSAPPEAVAAFLRASREVPELFQYGTMPKGAHSLEDFADEFGERAGKRIRVHESYGDADDYDEPFKIDVEKTHGRGELMRDRHGDYKYSDDPKVHGRGDYPMYDEAGNVKKVELQGPMFLPDDLLKVKRKAEGGEVMRDEYGNEKYPLAKSEGGEVMRDERGRVKYTEEENPDYNPPDPEDETILRIGDRRGAKEIKVTGYQGDEPTVYAMNADDEGALLYQTLLAHASQEGKRIGVDGLTPDNQFRILSNAVTNAARTGVNPRDVSGTLSGNRPRAKGFAEGDRIWQAETGEAEKRIAGQGADPNAVRFDGTQFIANGQPVTPDELASRLREFSPNVEGTKVGPKSVLRSAVYRWLENASPEEAEAAAKGWGKVGGPLFGVAGIGSLVAQLLRQDAKPEKD